MFTVFRWVVLILFSTATVALAVYGLHLYALLYLFRRRASRRRRDQGELMAAYHRGRSPEHYPVVTSQIPVYNEADVVRRVIDHVAQMDYPPGRHEVQVLDDSTDLTCRLIDDAIEEWRSRGVDIKVARRSNRQGYKAGALANGLGQARGEFVAVFDADFVPPRDFLRKAVPLLAADDGLACIQGRWEHLNRNQSWLTSAQAMGIDGHFAIEQGARAWNGLMMNFNGTAGVWRRAAIDDPSVGGWSGDTLTEDLDLSYRAQLAGWRLDYCLDMPCPAELPPTIAALKSQQRRWAQGSIQVACKLLPRIWCSRSTLGAKLEASLHLTHYSVALWMLMLAIVARPLLLVLDGGRVFATQWFVGAWVVILLSAIAPSLTYTYARYSLDGYWMGWRTIPSMLILGCGLCASNALAVLRGLWRRGGEFVRTPKSGSDGRTARHSSYSVAQSHLWVVEILLGLYSVASSLVYFRAEQRAFSLFLLIYAVGFLVVGWMSRPQRPSAPAAMQQTVFQPSSSTAPTGA